MLINYLKNNKMSIQKLSDISGVPYSSVREIVSGKTDFKKCTVETFYRLATALNMDMDNLYIICNKNEYDMQDYENFKNFLSHKLQKEGEIIFLYNVFADDTVTYFWEQKDYIKSFYLLAMTDHISKKNNIPLYEKYELYRKNKLERPLYPLAAMYLMNASQNKKDKEEIKSEYYRNAMPEFIKYNLIENYT